MFKLLREHIFYGVFCRLLGIMPVVVLIIMSGYANFFLSLTNTVIFVIAMTAYGYVFIWSEKRLEKIEDDVLQSRNDKQDNN